MIDVFYFSIAGKKTNQLIDDLVQSFIDDTYTPSTDKKLLLHTLEVSKNGNYPSKDYYLQFYKESAFSYNSLSEIVTYTNKVKDFYKLQSLNRQLVSAMNDSDSSQELLSRVESLTVNVSVSDENSLDEFKPILYSDSLDKPLEEGIMCGVSEIDTVTNGFQPGSIATIAAFTGHGKSTFINSILFKTAMLGKKCVLISLELSPQLVWPMIQARYLYQMKGLNVSSQDLLFHKLTSDIERKVNEFDSDFRNEVCSNLLIVDESVLNKQIVSNFRSLSKLFRTFEKQLGGLDFVALDHVGQLELLFPTMGNQILKNLQSVAKTFKNTKGLHVSMVWACQCNREGNKRANRRDGVYDLQAISDLNEVERSSSYVIFMYTSDDMKIVQETKITLSKHRLGSVLTEPIVTTFNPSISTIGSTIEKIQMSEDDLSSLVDFDFSDEF